MFHKLIELPTASLAIADVGTATREATRAGCTQLIELLTRGQAGQCASVSRSHSGSWIAVGFASSATIGVDIEVARPRARLAETARWLSLDCSDESSFYAHWTLREALAKSRGGSVLEPHACESELRAAAASPGKLIDTVGYSAWCGQLEGDIYYSLVLKHPPDYEAIIHCA